MRREPEHVSVDHLPARVVIVLLARGTLGMSNKRLHCRGGTGKRGEGAEGNSRAGQKTRGQER